MHSLVPGIVPPELLTDRGVVHRDRALQQFRWHDPGHQAVHGQCIERACGAADEQDRQRGIWPVESCERADRYDRRVVVGTCRSSGIAAGGATEDFSTAT